MMHNTDLANNCTAVKELSTEVEPEPNDKSTRWSVCPLKIPNGPSFKILFRCGNAVVDAVRSRQYIIAKHLRRSRVNATVEREFEEVEILRNLSLEFNLPLNMLLTYSTIHSLMREFEEENSYMLLLLSTFPRLLLMHPDLIPAQTMLEMDQMQINGFGKLNSNTTTTADITDSDSGTDTSSKHRKDTDNNKGYCTTDGHRMPQQQYRQEQIPKGITSDDLTYLRQLPPPICNRIYINLEFYCRELLESIESLSGSLVDQVIELENTDYPLPGGILYSDHGLNIETARQVAKAFCSSRVIIVYDHADGEVIIKDITLSGPRIVHPHRTTYHLGQQDVQPTLHRYRLRTITDNELTYLKQIRWQDRKPALLVAARCLNGIYFHVLKVIATFL